MVLESLLTFSLKQLVFLTSLQAWHLLNFDKLEETYFG